MATPYGFIWGFLRALLNRWRWDPNTPQAVMEQLGWRSADWRTRPQPQASPSVSQHPESIRKASGKHLGGGGDGARRHSWLFLSSCCVCVCPIGFVSSPSSSSPSSSSSSSSIPSVFSSVSYSNSAPFFLLFHFQEFIFHAEIPNRSGKISNSFPTVMQLFPNDFQISCNASTSFIAN